MYLYKKQHILYIKYIYYFRHGAFAAGYQTLVKIHINIHLSHSIHTHIELPGLPSDVKHTIIKIIKKVS